VTLVWRGAPGGHAIDVPMFEQLVDEHGRCCARRAARRTCRASTSRASAPGPSASAATPGTRRCACRTATPGVVGERIAFGRGHRDRHRPGTAGPAAVADRRTIGPPARWRGWGSRSGTLRLQWKWPIEVKTLVSTLYVPALAPEPTSRSTNASWSASGTVVRRTGGCGGGP
jgi:hypothetical protein